MTDRIKTVYLATRPEGDAHALGRAIALEQSVEVIEELVPDALRDTLVGRVESVEPAGVETWRITVSYAAEVAAGSLSQLFHLLFGNISFYPRLKLVNLELPEALTGALAGPRFGTGGIRRLTGVHGRALLATALKPRGSPVEHLADIAYRFAAGGGDLLKDDQNLVEEDFEDFKRRVDACAAAVERANQKTGRRCLYFPHITGAGDAIRRRAEFIHRRGIPGVLICPFVTGVEAAGRLAADYDLVYMAHPAAAGAFCTPPDHGIAAPVLIGTLLRLSGADISVFAGPGGRISSSAADSAGIAENLARPLGGPSRSLPCPAGGKTLDMLPGIARAYGPDCAVLVGGDLLRARARLESVTRQCIDRLSEIHAPRLEPPLPTTAGACDVPSGPPESTLSFLKHEVDFEWRGRESTSYKSDRTLPFSGIKRVELLGGDGEHMHFVLRYFELAPGGYTSLEKHLHTHVIIGARGRGVLVEDDEERPLAEHDIAYIRPLAVHQLRNDGDRPFGFYCLVDRERDRPMAP